MQANHYIIGPTTMMRRLSKDFRSLKLVAVLQSARNSEAAVG